MSYYEELKEHYWTHPDSYAGFSPDGDVLVYSTYRDSDLVNQSNWETIREELFALNEKFEAPENPDLESGDNPYVYDFRASCSLFGWHEYLLIRQDAPEEIMEEVYSIVAALEAYPVYDEEDWVRRETEATEDYWEQCSYKEKCEFYRENDETPPGGFEYPEDMDEEEIEEELKNLKKQLAMYYQKLNEAQLELIEMEFYERDAMIEKAQEVEVRIEQLEDDEWEYDFPESVWDTPDMVRETVQAYACGY